MINFEEGFDARAYLSKLRTPSEESEAVAKINELSDLSTALSTEIDRRVGAHYEELVGQATALRDAAAMIREISKSIAQLQQALKQVKLEMLAPYERIKEKTQQLQSLHESAETVRTVLRFLQLYKTLKESAGDLSELKLGGDIPNLTRAAATHSELSALMKDSQPLRGIPLVEGSREYIRRVGEALVSGADHVMTQGLETLNQADIANALQAYRYIGKLDDGVWDATSSVVDKASTSVGNALVSGGGNDMGLWQRVTLVVEALIKASSQGWALGAALVKTRDTATGEPLNKVTAKFREELPINVIWRSLSKMTADKFALASRSSSSMEMSLINEYPKLFKTFQDFITRLSSSLTSVPDAQEQMIKAIQPFEKAYINASFNKLVEPIKSYITQRGVGSEASQNIYKILLNELESVKGTPYLVDLVTRQVVSRSIQYIITCAEPLISRDPTDAYQVRDRMTPQQMQNAATFQSLVMLHSSLVQLSTPGTWLPTACCDVIIQSCKNLEALATSCIDKLIENELKLLESSIYLIHTENFAPTKVSGNSFSAYIVTLDKQIRSFQTQFVSRLAPCPLLTGLLGSLVGRLMDIFVLHSSLIRPLTEAGKVQLANDMAQFEACLAFIQQPRLAEGSYAQFRAFRPLIYREVGEIGELKGEELFVLPPSVVLHHLFSRAPNDMQSPYMYAKMSLGQYKEWLAKHSQMEIWMSSVKPCVEAYAGKDTEIKGIIEKVGPVLLERWNQKEKKDN